MLVRYGEVCYEKGYDVEWKGTGIFRRLYEEDEI